MANEGWSRPADARKWHYFRDGRSLCGRWGMRRSRHLEPDDEPSADDCAACRRTLDAEKGKR